MSITEHPNSPGQVVTRTAGTRAAGGVGIITKAARKPGGWITVMWAGESQEVNEWPEDLTVIPAEELTK